MQMQDKMQLTWCQKLKNTKKTNDNQPPQIWLLKLKTQYMKTWSRRKNTEVKDLSIGQR